MYKVQPRLASSHNSKRRARLVTPMATPASDQVCDIHRHFINLRGVELLDVSQNADSVALDEVNGYTSKARMQSSKNLIERMLHKTISIPSKTQHGTAREANSHGKASTSYEGHESTSLWPAESLRSQRTCFSITGITLRPIQKRAKD
eukprot:2985318-Amphidinium_carterae.1